MRDRASNLVDASLQETADGWPPDGGLVMRAQAGNLAAQRQLYDVCCQRVYRTVYRMVGLADAADVTQEVFLQVFRSLHLFSGLSRFETWLFRISINECLQYRRRCHRRRCVALEHDPLDKHPDTSRCFDHQELMEQALTRLEPELRAVFLLKEVEHLSYFQIAEALQIPEGTIGSRLNRARRQLQSILVELGWDA